MPKKILIKIGGEVAESEETANTLLQDLITLRKADNQVVLCHGGGPQITRELKKQGIEARFVNGQRVTDADTLKITRRILLEDINASLVSLCNRNEKIAVGLSGLDGELYFSKERDPALGFVGKIEKVNTAHLVSLIENGLIPVVASLGIGSSGQVFNINADSAAGDLAAALSADYYLVFTNVEGLYSSFPDKNSLVKETDLAGLEALLENGSVSEGMIPKIESITSALKAGVKKAVIVDGRKEHAVLNTVNSLNEGGSIFGTLITK
jgi:acetylglutamate kinase